jgi:hypothetical protein
VRRVPFAHGCSQDVGRPSFFFCSPLAAERGHTSTSTTRTAHTPCTTRMLAVRTRTTPMECRLPRHTAYTPISQRCACAHAEHLSHLCAVPGGGHAPKYKKSVKPALTRHTSQGERKQPQNLGASTHNSAHDHDYTRQQEACQRMCDGGKSDVGRACECAALTRPPCNQKQLEAGLPRERRQKQGGVCETNLLQRGWAFTGQPRERAAQRSSPRSSPRQTHLRSVRLLVLPTWLTYAQRRRCEIDAMCVTPYDDDVG